MQTFTPVILDRDSEVWVGSYPGLGEVRVSPDGDFTVIPDRPGDEQQIAALTHGWAQPLAWARQGFRLASASTIVDPAGRCLALHGDAHDAALIMLHFTQAGWTVLADRPAPMRWDGGALVAYPNPAPILISQRRADKESLPARAVREDSDSVEVNLPRSTTPTPVAAVISARARRVNDPLLEPLTGHKRFEAANGLLLAGALVLEENPQASMTETLKMAGMPWARSHIESAARQEACEAIQAWWDDLWGTE